MVKQESPLLNQYISGLVIPAIKMIQTCIFNGDYYGCLRAHEVLMPLLWKPEEKFVQQALKQINAVRSKANEGTGVDTESRLRDFHFNKQVLAEPLALSLYYAIMTRINSEGFFEYVSGVLGTAVVAKSGEDHTTLAIPPELSNKV